MKQSHSLWLTPAAVGAVAGGILALAYPPFSLGFLAVAGLALALSAVGLDPSAPLPPIRTVAWRAWVFGFVFHVAALYWIGWVSIFGMLTMAAILGLYIAIVFAASAFLLSRLGSAAIWLFPVIWIAHEYLRGFGALAFPWTNLSLSQVNYHALIQYADVTGDLGIGLVVALLSVSLLLLVRRLSVPSRRHIILPAMLLVLGILLPYLYGRHALPQISDTAVLRVAVLQGDIDSFRKWDEGYADQSMAVYETQTRAAAAHGAELIVWPETAAPMYLRAEERYRRELARLSADLHAALLVGTLEYNRAPADGYLRYNAAVALVDGRYESAFHAKLHLVPFGEWIPFSDRFRMLDKLEVGGAHFTAGDRYVLFAHPKGPYAAAICYESAFPGIIRRFVGDGARFLVTITNDGWYGFSSGPSQHAAIAVFRCIESRRPMARAANTGISGFVDRTGNYHDVTRQYVPDVRICDLGLGPADQRTFFIRHGMFVGQACLLVTIFVLLVAAFMRTRERLDKLLTESSPAQGERTAP